MMDTEKGGSDGGEKRPKYKIDRPATVESYRQKKEMNDDSSSMWDVIYNWPDYTQVWPLVYGPAISGVAAGMMGAFVNYKFRSYVVLDNIGVVSSYVAAGGGAVACQSLAHYGLVSSDIVERKTACPVCVQVRSACLQVGLGLVYPIGITCATNMATMARMKSMRMPSIVKKPMDVLSYTKEVVLSFKKPLIYGAMLQAVLAAGITYLEQDTFYTSVAPYFANRTIEEVKPADSEKLSS